MTILKNNSLVQKIVASLFILILCLPLLGRSLWVDEAMLFSNNPLPHIIDIFRPLPYYDQAATPFYSVLMSVIGNYDDLFPNFLPSGIRVLGVMNAP